MTIFHIKACNNMTSTRHAGHCWRSRDELISDVFLWTPSHGWAKAGGPARTYILQLCEDMGCSPEDLPDAMYNREKWQERVKDIRADVMTRWWWWKHWFPLYSPKLSNDDLAHYLNGWVLQNSKSQTRPDLVNSNIFEVTWRIIIDMKWLSPPLLFFFLSLFLHFSFFLHFFLFFPFYPFPFLFSLLVPSEWVQ